MLLYKTFKYKSYIPLRRFNVSDTIIINYTERNRTTELCKLVSYTFSYKQHVSITRCLKHNLIKTINMYFYFHVSLSLIRDHLYIYVYVYTLKCNTLATHSLKKNIFFILFMFA